MSATFARRDLWGELHYGVYVVGAARTVRGRGIGALLAAGPQAAIAARMRT